MKKITNIRRLVFIIPSLAILDAASLVDLHVLGLIDENTAMHLQYGTSRVYENTTHRMLVYNMGATSTQVRYGCRSYKLLVISSLLDIVTHITNSIAEYSSAEKKHLGKNITAGVFEIKAKAWDETLGGNNFDQALIDFFVSDFNAKHRKGKMVVAL